MRTEEMWTLRFVSYEALFSMSYENGGDGDSTISYEALFDYS